MQTNIISLKFSYTLEKHLPNRRKVMQGKTPKQGPGILQVLNKCGPESEANQNQNPKDELKNKSGFLPL